MPSIFLSVVGSGFRASRDPQSRIQGRPLVTAIITGLRSRRKSRCSTLQLRSRAPASRRGRGCRRLLRQNRAAGRALPAHRSERRARPPRGGQGALPDRARRKEVTPGSPVQHTKEVQKHDDAEGNAKQPEQKIASHCLPPGVIVRRRKRAFRPVCSRKAARGPSILGKQPHGVARQQPAHDLDVGERRRVGDLLRRDVDLAERRG